MLGSEALAAVFLAVLWVALVGVLETIYPDAGARWAAALSRALRDEVR